MQIVHGRQLRVLLISGEHRVKAVSGREHDFWKIRTMSAGNLGRKNIFEFVSEFAEFVKPASGRITLEGMHNAANAPNDLFVRRARLKFQPGFVERLQ